MNVLCVVVHAQEDRVAILAALPNVSMDLRQTNTDVSNVCASHIPGTPQKSSRGKSSFRRCRQICADLDVS